MPPSPQTTEAGPAAPPRNPSRCGWTVAYVALVWLAVVPMAAEAQDLPLKREVHSHDPFRCPDAGSVEPGDDDARERAAGLEEETDLAVILGDLEQARSLLARAADLDPTSAALAYRYARVLDDLDEGAPAAAQYCRALALDSLAVGANEARARIRELREEGQADIPVAAVTAFRAGLESADDRRLSDALQSFARAVENAPEWPEAVYDRGVVHARLGQPDRAVADLRRYLELRPDAPDAIAVSERIGALQATTRAPLVRRSPGTALALGTVVPGMGQLYAGRPGTALAVASAVGASVAAALLIKDVEVRCLADPAPGGSCPPELVLDETMERPYLVPGLGVAAALTVVGAVEAFINLRGRNAPGEGLASASVGRARVGALDVAPSRMGVELRLFHLAF